MSDAMVNPPRFGGQPGAPVHGLTRRTSMLLGNFSRNFKAEHPGEPVVAGASLAPSICKPGADIRSVGYRSSIMRMMTRFASEQIAPFLNNGEPTDAVFRAAAKVQLEWMGVGLDRHGLPFDVNEFLRLCAEET